MSTHRTSKNNSRDTAQDRGRRARPLPAVVNGKLHILGVDNRSRAARRFRELYRKFIGQTGGLHEDICKQAATLIVQREHLDAQVLQGHRVDTIALVRLSNSINRTLARIEQVKAKKLPDDEKRRREREDREALLA